MILYFATFSILMYFHFRIFSLYMVLFDMLVIILNLYMFFHFALFSLLFSHITHLVVATNTLLIYEILKPVFSVLLSQ